MTAGRLKYYRVLFIGAGVFNSIVALLFFFQAPFMSAIFFEGSAVAQSHLFFYLMHTLSGIFLLFGLAYVWGGLNPESERNVGFIIIGCVCKLSIFVTCLVYYINEITTLPILLLAGGDLTYALFFAEYLLFISRLKALENKSPAGCF